MRSFLIFIAFLFVILQPAGAKDLKPGFDADEYIEVLQRCAGQIKHTIFAKTAAPLTFHKVYTSPEVGLHNRWELWESDDKTTIAVNLRGTVSAVDNGLENIYAAMIPATGKLKMSGSTEFNYQFADNPRALVHAGWTLGICSMIPDIVNHIQEYYGKGMRQVIIEGHSQGGAMAYLLRSHLHYQGVGGKLPKDIVYKTYCSAAPKPGNLYYAYDFDAVTRDGWAFNVVSSIDWVPEMPFTIQRYSDVNEVSPFNISHPLMKKQNIFIRLYLRHVYNRTNRASRRAQRRYQHYLGHKAYKFVRRYMKGVGRPEYAASTAYATAGTRIVLVPDEAYYKQFASIKQHMFMHHFFEQYYFLVKHIYKHEGV